MIERYHCVGMYILCLGLVAVVGCGMMQADLTIVELSTSQALNRVKKPIRNSVRLTAKIRNDGNWSAKLDYASKIDRALLSTAAKILGESDREESAWVLGIEARYKSGGNWESLRGPSGWIVPDQEKEKKMFSSSLDSHVSLLS